jgi:hypothetical protein
MHQNRLSQGKQDMSLLKMYEMDGYGEAKEPENQVRGETTLSPTQPTIL